MYKARMTLYEAIRAICDRIEHGSIEGEKEILDALEEALATCQS